MKPRMHMDFNLRVVMSYISCSKTVLDMDCVSINLFYYLYFIYYSFFVLVNYWISDRFLFKWEKKSSWCQDVTSCKTERFLSQKLFNFFFHFLWTSFLCLILFFIHSLNLKRILHPKATFSAVCLNTYERFSPQQLLKSTSIF